MKRACALLAGAALFAIPPGGPQPGTVLPGIDTSAEIVVRDAHSLVHTGLRGMGIGTRVGPAQWLFEDGTLCRQHGDVLVCDDVEDKR